MSLIFGCFSQNYEDSDEQEENLKKRIGKERILRLNHEEKFTEKIKNFKIIKEINIYEKENEKADDIYNLNKEKIFDFSNLCLFCGGNNCNSEKLGKNAKFAIKGLITQLFYECIFISQRLNTNLIKKYNLINNFKENNIKLIINCEIYWEHPKCGPINGIESDSGFTYFPSCFIENGIDYLNYGFPEDECPFTLDFMLDIVKKISYIIKYKKGKVFVHGHSPDGRSCLVVACFGIFYFNKTANEAIREIREKRENAFNNKNYEEFCMRFEIYIKMLKNIFTKRPISIDKFIKYQNDINIDINQKNVSFIFSNIFNNKFCDTITNENEFSEIINVNYIPNIILKCLDKIIYLKNKLNLQNKELYQILNEQNIFSQDEYNKIVIIKNDINNNIWKSFEINEDLLIIKELFFTWIHENVISCINSEKIDKLFQISINSSNKFEDIFKENYNISIKELIEITKIFSNIFNKTELECIKYISIFISLIYPNTIDENGQNTEEINEFKKFIYKLSLLLLGYNLSKIDDITTLYGSKEYLIAKNLILILEVFIFCSLDDEENNQIEKKNENNDFINDYLNMKKKINENIYYEENSILMFFKAKNKINFESIKYLL